MELGLLGIHCTDLTSLYWFKLYYPFVNRKFIANECNRYSATMFKSFIFNFLIFSATLGHSNSTRYTNQINIKYFMNNINTIHALCQVLFEIDYRATWMRPVIFTDEDVFYKTYSSNCFWKVSISKSDFLTLAATSYAFLGSNQVFCHIARLDSGIF